MHRLQSLLITLLLALTAWTGAAHAAETAMCLEPLQTELAAHIAGDGDEVPADAGKDYPHHHASCHGHDIVAPREASVTTDAGASGSAYGPPEVPAWRAHEGERALRPPRA